MATTRLWTREELLVAFTLYSQIPFGKFHATNPDIIHYANLIGRTPASLAMKLSNFASLDPVIIESGRIGLKGASKADRALWAEMNKNESAFEQQCMQAMRILEKPVRALNDNEMKDFTGRERKSIVKARVGQQLFRKHVLQAYEFRCCITELEEPVLLVASHIRPWSHGTEHRLNPSNGLCLSSLHDRAFDQGLIAFNEHLELIISPQIKKLKSIICLDNFDKYEGKKIRSPVNFPPDQEQLEYHRKEIFRSKS